MAIVNRLQAERIIYAADDLRESLVRSGNPDELPPDVQKLVARAKAYLEHTKRTDNEAERKRHIRRAREKGWIE